MPKISIVILTHNSIEFIKACLDSVFAQDDQGFEVIVVDNGSKDATVDLIKKNYTRVVLIENKENLGSCRARNQGIEISKGEWILTLDCDIILAKDFISQLIIKTETLPSDIGLIQSKILKVDRKTIYSTGIFLSSIRRFYDIGKGKSDNGQFNASKYIFGVCSAAALYRRQMFEEVKEDAGYFDERFFFLVEDVDLSWRAQRKGWRAIFYPNAICYHFGNSSRLPQYMRQYLCFRNRYYSIKKNEGMINYMLKVFPVLIYDLPRFIFIIIRHIIKAPIYKINKIFKKSIILEIDQ